jgi:uncharacterized membrane protein YfcA
LLIFLFAAAFAAGFIDSIAGGGGLVSLPALMIAGVPPHVALGTNKLQSVFGTFFATINYARKDKVIWKAAFVGIPLALIGSALGAKLTLFLSIGLMAKILIFLLPPATILMFLSNSLLKEKDVKSSFSTRRLTAVALVCFFIGLYDGFYGPGTGTFLIVLLVLVCRIPLLHASATAKTFNLASNIGAVVTFALAGKIYYSMALIMAVANIAGNLTGSQLAIKKGNNFIQRFVYLAILILFVYLLFNYRNY